MHSSPGEFTQEAPDGPEVSLISVEPSYGQRTLAGLIVASLIIAFVATVPVISVKLAEFDSFVPSLAAALFINDAVISALLFAQFSVVRKWTLLLLAGSYLFTALTVVAHALTFPGGFSPTGLMGAGLQSAVWLYFIWHSALPLAVIAHALWKDSKYRLNQGSAQAIILLTIAVVIAAAIASVWFVIVHQDLLPVLYVDVRPISFFRQVIGGVMVLLLGTIALGMLWVRRQSVLDLWLMVGIFAFLLEVLMAAILSGSRFTVGWYAGRFYQLATAAVVLFALLWDTMSIYTALAGSIVMQRWERDRRMMSVDAATAAMAHELRQPLAALLTNSEAALRFLKGAPPDLGEARQAITAAIDCCRRGDKIISTVRGMFRKSEGERAAIGINELVQQVLKLVDQDLRVHAVSASSALAGDLPTIRGNRVQLQQVLLNLIGNAIDAINSGSGESRQIRITTSSYDPSAILLAVEDSGPGIDFDDEIRIFEPFFTTKSNGTGLGLAICRSIVDDHGGRIWVSRVDPYGSRFNIVLPIDEDGDNPAVLQ